jgi:hypothetical protein
VATSIADTLAEACRGKKLRRGRRLLWQLCGFMGDMLSEVARHAKSRARTTEIAEITEITEYGFLGVFGGLGGLLGEAVSTVRSHVATNARNIS